MLSDDSSGYMRGGSSAPKVRLTISSLVPSESSQLALHAASLHLVNHVSAPSLFHNTVA